MLRKAVEEVGDEVQAEHHLDSLGLEVVGSLYWVSLVSRTGADVGDSEGDRERRLQGRILLSTWS